MATISIWIPDEHEEVLRRAGRSPVALAKRALDEEVRRVTARAGRAAPREASDLALTEADATKA